MSLKTDNMPATSRLPRLATNYAILSGTEFISKLLSAIAFAYLARVLGPQNYGYLEFTIAIVFFFTLIVDSGLSSIGAREFAKDRDALAKLFIHITATRSVLAVLAFFILLAIALFIPLSSQVKWLIFLYSLTMFLLPWLIQWVFQGRDMMHYVALASFFRWTLFTAGVFLFIHQPEQAWMVPLIEGFAILSIAAFLLWALSHTFGIPHHPITPSYALSIFRKALPIGASEFVWAIKVYFATILLGLLIGGAVLGWFTAAHRIIIALHSFVWLYFYNLLPSIARASQQPLDVIQRLMRISLQATTWVIILIAALGTAYAKLGITLLYGAQFEASAAAFQVLIWAIPLTLFSGHYRYMLIGFDKQKLEFFCSLLGAAANILINLILIPRYGLLGAAWAFVISEVIIWGSAYLFVRRTITVIPFLPHLWRPLLAGIAFFIVYMLLLPRNMWLAGFAATGLYLAILLITQPNLISYIRSMGLRSRT